MCLKNMHGYLSYSWTGHQKRTPFTSICRETERATTDLNIRINSSWRGASKSLVAQDPFLFFDVFLNTNFPNNYNEAWVTKEFGSPRQIL